MSEVYSVNLKKLEARVRLGYHHLYLSLVKGERELKFADAVQVADALGFGLEQLWSALNGRQFQADSRQDEVVVTSSGEKPKRRSRSTAGVI